MDTGYKDVNGENICEGDTIFTVEASFKAIVRFGKYSVVSDNEDNHLGFYLEFEKDRYRKLFRKEFLYWVKEGIEVCNKNKSPENDA